MYNQTVRAFFRKHKIKPKKISKILDTKVLNENDINPIINKYGLYKKQTIQNVSIGNIYGYLFKTCSMDYDLFESFSNLFEEGKGTYKSRSCHNLYLSKDEMLNSESFLREPMTIKKLQPETYFISSNGLHRYVCLRILYLSELSKNLENEKQIKEKYTIKAMVGELDTLKTLCNFVITSINPEIIIMSQIDDKYQKTGNVTLKTPESTYVLTDEELIEITQELLEKNPDFIPENLDNILIKQHPDNLKRKKVLSLKRKLI